MRGGSLPTLCNEKTYNFHFSAVMKTATTKFVEPAARMQKIRNAYRTLAGKLGSDGTMCFSAQ
jgi:hypothetical protein